MFAFSAARFPGADNWGLKSCNCRLLCCRIFSALHRLRGEPVRVPATAPVRGMQYIVSRAVSIRTVRRQSPVEGNVDV